MSEYVSIRRVWLMAAREVPERRYKREALWNAVRFSPSLTWSTGQQLFGVEDTKWEQAARILAFDAYEPRDECEHGFVLPRGCPNDVCADRAIEWAWYVGRYGEPPFELRLADAAAATENRHNPTPNDAR